MKYRVLRVGICDDSADAREQLSVYLSIDKRLVVSGMYGSGPQALAGVVADAIDVLLLDVRMPGMGGPEVASRLAASVGGCKVIYLTSYPDEVPVRGPLRRTVLGALSKDITPEMLAGSIRAVASGVSLLGPEFIGSSASAGRLGPTDLQADTTNAWPTDPRRREVLRLVCKGMSNPEIGRELHMSSSAVKRVVTSLCREAKVNGRAALASYSSGIGVFTDQRNGD